TASENKIHDDAVARSYGFDGGLVPGVTVYAYLTHPVVAELGRAWLERGTMTTRFVRPCYDGDHVIVDTDPRGDVDVPTLDLTALRAAAGPADHVVATATASLPAIPPRPPALRAVRRRSPALRPRAGDRARPRCARHARVVGWRVSRRACPRVPRRDRGGPSPLPGRRPRAPGVPAAGRQLDLRRQRPPGP